MNATIITRRRLAVALWTMTLVAGAALAEPRASSDASTDLTVSAIVLPHCVIGSATPRDAPRVECRRNGAAYSITTDATDYREGATEVAAAASIVEVTF